MAKMKKIVYALSSIEMDTYYCEFKWEFYTSYPQLQRHFEILWERRQFWAHSYHSGLPMRGNHTNNYIERSFDTLKHDLFCHFARINQLSYCTLTCQKYPDSSKNWLLNCNISPSSDRINLKHISSESPWPDVSNGGIFMRLGSNDEEIIRNF